MQTQRVGALYHYSRHPHAPLPAAVCGSSVISANKCSVLRAPCAQQLRPMVNFASDPARGGC
eukprot:3718369-Alexandrium_andersonii.AAC.1